MRAALTRRKSTKDAETQAGLRFMCQTDLFALASIIMGRKLGEQNLLSETFHNPLCDYVQTTPYQINLYLLARDHLKTTILTVAKHVQRLLRDPQSRGLIASNKAEASSAMLSEIKGHLQDEWLVALFPEILYVDPQREAEKWTSEAITVKRSRRTKEASIETIGVEGEVTSKHFDHGTFDDIVGLQNSQTRDEIQKTINWFRIAQSLFEPQATQDIIGTPWAFFDLYAWLQEQAKAGVLKLGVYKRPCWLVDAEGQVIRDSQGHEQPAFPEKFTRAKLFEVKAIKGSAMFAAQYLLDPTDEETAVFVRKKILPNILPRKALPPVDTLALLMTVDPAISTKAWADYTAIAVTGWDNEGRMYILDLRRGRWAENETLAQIYDCYRRFPSIHPIGFEAIGFAKIFRQLLTREGQVRGQYLPVISLERDTKTTKNVRIRTLQPLWENGEIFIADDVPALEDLLDEADRFRTYKESAHDDLLDALADSLQLRMMPGTPQKPREYLIDDPEIVARLEYEDECLATNPTLDRASLRNAYGMKRRRDLLLAEHEMAAGTSAMGEFY